MTQSDTPNPEPQRFKIPFWVWAAVIAAVLFFVVSLWQAQTLRTQLAELQEQLRLAQKRRETLEAQRREVDQIRLLLGSPETRAIQMRPTTSETKPAKIFWHERLGILVSLPNVPELPADRVLHLWIAVKDGRYISGGVFRPGADGSVLQLTRPSTSVRVKDASALGIFVEPAAGRALPDGEPFWVGKIN